MNVFEIIGPIMVGPSSSHTAGAVRIGFVARKLLYDRIHSAEILLYGSFLRTGKGHGTDKALVAGLLGMQPDDRRIPMSFELAKYSGMNFRFGEAHLRDAHPNTAVLKLRGVNGGEITVQGESVGGGRINISHIDGAETRFGGDRPTLIVRNIDRPGYIAEITGALSRKKVNIATIQSTRDIRGGSSVLVLECDDEVTKETLAWLRAQKGILKVIYYSPVPEDWV